MFSRVPLFYKIMVHFENTGQERKAPKPLKNGWIAKMYMYAKKRDQSSSVDVFAHVVLFKSDY